MKLCYMPYQLYLQAYLLIQLIDATHKHIYLYLRKGYYIERRFVQGDSTVMTTCIGAHITVIQSPRVYTFQLI